MQENIVKKRRSDRNIDPDPFTIVAAIVGVIGAGAAVIPVWSDFRKPLPSALLARVRRMVGDIQNELRYLRSDVDEVERIFKDAQFHDGRYVRLGNGARLSPGDFEKYRVLSSEIFRRLNKLHDRILVLEKTTVKIKFIDDMMPAVQVEKFRSDLESILVARDVSYEMTWETLRRSIDQLKDFCDNLIQ